MSWYETDNEFKDKLYTKTEKKNHRFWCRIGESVNIVFMDNTPILFNEHSVKLEGKWGYFFTCLKHLKDSKGLPLFCPLCDDGKFKAKRVAALPIINLTSFTTKDGRQIDFFRQIFVMLGGVYRLLKQRVAELREEGKELKGAKFKLTRIERATLLDYKEHVDLNEFKVKGEVIQPLNITEICKPDKEAVYEVMSIIKAGRKRAKELVENKNEEKVDISDLDEAPW